MAKQQKPLHFEGRLMRAEEIAEILGISMPTVYRLAKSGHLPQIKIGNCVRFHPVDVQNCIVNFRATGGFEKYAQ